MAGKLTKQKMIRMTEGEARFIQKESFNRDRSESWIIREALSKVYPEIFQSKKSDVVVVSKDEKSE